MWRARELFGRSQPEQVAYCVSEGVRERIPGANRLTESNDANSQDLRALLT